MEKISKVVPSSVKNKIDMTRERPMRSGAPNYGAPIAHSAITLKKMEEEEQAKRLATRASVPDSMSPLEMKHSEIVDKVTLSFNQNGGASLKPEEMIQTEMAPSTLVEEMSIDNTEDVRENLLSPQQRTERLSLYA